MARMINRPAGGASGGRGDDAFRKEAWGAAG